MSDARAIIVRLAEPEDVPAIADMVDDFGRDHPARNHPRSIDDLHDAHFGPNPVVEMIVAQRANDVVGMGHGSVVAGILRGTVRPTR